MIAKNRYILGILILLIVCISVISYAYIYSDTNTKERFKVSVIVYGGTNNRWNVLKEGVNQAAADNNLEINFIVISNDKNVSEQCNTITREIENGADGIIVAVIDSEEMTNFILEKTAEVPIVLLESSISAEINLKCLTIDDYQAGRDLGASVKRSWGENRRIGIVMGSQQRNCMPKRYQGFIDEMKDTEAVLVEWQTSGLYASKEALINRNLVREPVDIIVGLDSIGLEAAIDVTMEMEAAIDVTMEKEADIQLYGIGNTEKIVYYMDKGVIQEIIFPNEFNMGYLGMEIMLDYINYRDSIKEYIIDYKLINKENMYQKDNQRLIFPIVQ